MPQLAILGQPLSHLIDETVPGSSTRLLSLEVARAAGAPAAAAVLIKARSLATSVRVGPIRQAVGHHGDGCGGLQLTAQAVAKQGSRYAVELKPLSVCHNLS